MNNLDKGKCYSKVDVGQRLRLDRYQTPLGIMWSSEHIFKGWEGKKVLEPCVGKGAIMQSLQSLYGNKINLVGRDLVETGDNFYETEDKFDILITNPPYSSTHLFIEKCYEVAPIIFLLIPLTHLQGQKRYFDKTYRHLKKVWVLNRMPMFEGDYREDGKFATGMQAVAWFEFDTAYVGEPTIGFVDISGYVLKKGE